MKKELDICFEKTNDANDYRKLVPEYQKYSVSLDSYTDEHTITTLSEIMEQIEKKLEIYFQLINMKISEISSARLSLTNIILSIVAVVVAVFAIA